MVVESSSDLSILYALPLIVVLVSVGLRNSAKPARLEHLPSLPVWILLEGFIISKLIIAGGLFRRFSYSIRRRGGSLFGFSSLHHVVYGQQIAKDLLRRPLSVVHNEPAQWHLTVKVFGACQDQRPYFIGSMDELNHAISRSMTQEATVKRILARAFRIIEDAVPCLISPQQGFRMPWEKAAGQTSSQANSTRDEEEAKVDLFKLMRNFTAHITTSSLFGSDFLREYPRALDDLWQLDAAFTALAIGVPAWAPIPLIRRAVRARERLKREISALHARLDAEADGSASDELRARLLDVSPMIRLRNQVMRKHNFDDRTKGPFDLTIMWASNGNTSNFTFWLVTYIYSTPGLLSQLREEVDPHIKVAEDGSISSMEREPIINACPLLKSTYLETFRLAHEPTSIRYVAQSFSVIDSVSNRDTRIAAGTFFTVPHTIYQHDARVFPEPKVFKPSRFIGTIEAENAAPRRVVQYGPLKPWGDGTGMCRGRIFAEREVLTIVACVISLWDIQPLGDKWNIPPKKTGTGVCLPDGDLPVKVSRRLS